MPYKVSVIIPIYNSEKYLRECLESVAIQTLGDIQVIMVDDGSTDTSADICKEYVKKGLGFEYYYKENGGSASARNVGLENAKGEYIGFVDSDDTIQPEYFELLYGHAKDKNADIVSLPYASGKKYAEMYIVPEQGIYQSYALTDKILPNVLPRINGNGTFRSMDWSNCTKLISRQLVEHNHIRYFTGSRRCEDLAFMLECTLHAQSYYVSHESDLYYYRPSENSKSRHYTKNMWVSISALMSHIGNIVGKQASLRYNECVFWFCCMSIGNELMSDDKRKIEKNIQAILMDPLCYETALSIDHVRLNRQYRDFYEAIKTRNSRKVISVWRYWKWKKEKLSPILAKLMRCSCFSKIYHTVRRVF